VFHFAGNRLCANYTGEELWKSELLGDIRGALAVVAEKDERGYVGPATPFEALMDEWSTAERQEHLGVVQRLLAYALNFGYSCAFTECRDRFDDLLAWFQPTIVVTVNYDTLVVEAMLRRSRRCWYPGLEGARGPGGEGIEIVGTVGDVVPFFKLHGSVNWVTIYGFGCSADDEVTKRIADARPTHIVESGPFIVRQSWATSASSDRSSLLYELEDNEVSEPVVALYGTGKHLLDNPVHVGQHRDACLARLRDASISRVLAVGIRPVSQEDDPVVAQLIRQLGVSTAEKRYVSPSAAECEEMHRRGGFVPVRATLAEFIDTLRHRLKRYFFPGQPPTDDGLLTVAASSEHSAGSSEHKVESSAHSGGSSEHTVPGSERGEIAPSEWEKLQAQAASLRAGRRASPDEVSNIIVGLCLGRALTLPQISHLTGRKPQSVRVHYLAKLLAEGRLRLLHPDAPTHPSQAYVGVE
jgi:hypothetical protein